MKKLMFLFFMILGLNLYSQNLDKDTIKVQEVEVVADLPYQATNRVPITFKNLTQRNLSYVNYGQDLERIDQAMYG